MVNQKAKYTIHQSHNLQPFSDNVINECLIASSQGSETSRSRSQMNLKNLIFLQPDH